MNRKSTFPLLRNVRSVSLAVIALLSAGTAFADKQNSNNLSNQTTIGVTAPHAQYCWGWNPAPWCNPLNVCAAKHNVTCNGAGNGSIDLSVSGGTAPYTYLWSDGETTQDITDLDPGTYSVTVSDASGQTYNGSYTITEPAVFNPSINVGNSSYCYYSSCASTDPATIYVGYGSQCVTLSANVGWSGGPYTYTWTSTNGTVNNSHSSSITVCPTTPTTYILTITNGNGCTAIKNQFINVVNVQGPNGTVVICHHPSTSSCGGGSSTTTTNTTMYVQPCMVAYHLCHGDDLGACPSNNPVPRGVAGADNSAGVEIPAEFSIYPNPSAGTFTMDMPDMSDAAQIRVTDINGRIAEVRSVDAHQPQKMQFNFSDKAKGMYLIEVKCGENIFRNKVIIQ
ncbi:T9SS type A sorting domain-containing protein [Chitinophagaceae bacterium MMS25-I14]